MLLCLRVRPRHFFVTAKSDPDIGSFPALQSRKSFGTRGVFLKAADKTPEITPFIFFEKKKKRAC